MIRTKGPSRRAIGFDSASAARRLERFHRSLAISTRHASPLVLDVVATGGLPLHRILRWVRPAPRVKDVLAMRFSHILRHYSFKTTMSAYYGRTGIDDLRFRELWRSRGVVIRKPSHPRGCYGLWIEDGCLNVEVSLGSATLRVEGPRARLLIPAVVPLTLQVALPGRRVADVAPHPLFAGRDYAIAAASDDGKRTIIEFETGLLRFALPVGGRTAGGRRRRSSLKKPPGGA